MVGPRGFEPRSSDSKSDILPLNDGPVCLLVRPAGLAPALRLWKSRVPLRTLQPRYPESTLHLFPDLYSLHFGCRTGTRTPISWFRARRPAIERSGNIWPFRRELHPGFRIETPACWLLHHGKLAERKGIAPLSPGLEPGMFLFTPPLCESAVFGAPGGARTHTCPVKSRRLCLSSSRRVFVLPSIAWIVPPGGFEPPPHGVKIRCAAG